MFNPLSGLANPATVALSPEGANSADQGSMLGIPGEGNEFMGVLAEEIAGLTAKADNADLKRPGFEQALIQGMTRDPSPIAHGQIADQILNLGNTPTPLTFPQQDQVNGDLQQLNSIAQDAGEGALAGQLLAGTALSPENAKLLNEQLASQVDPQFQKNNSKAKAKKGGGSIFLGKDQIVERFNNVNKTKQNYLADPFRAEKDFESVQLDKGKGLPNQTQLNQILSNKASGERSIFKISNRNQAQQTPLQEVLAGSKNKADQSALGAKFNSEDIQSIIKTGDIYPTKPEFKIESSNPDHYLDNQAIATDLRIPQLNKGDAKISIDTSMLQGVESAELIEKISNLINELSLQSGKGVKMSFVDNKLGHFDIKVINMGNDQLNVTIQSSSPEGLSFFRESKNEMVNNLLNTGIQLAGFNVEESGHSQKGNQAGSDRSGSENNQSGGQKGYNQREHAREDSDRRRHLWEQVANRMEA